MPCKDYAPPPDVPYLSNDDLSYPSSVLEKELSRKLDHLTALLCEACEVLVSNDLGSFLSTDLQSWWLEHQKADQLRLKHEADLAEFRLAEAEKRKLEKDQKAPQKTAKQPYKPTKPKKPKRKLYKAKSACPMALSFNSAFQFFHQSILVH